MQFESLKVFCDVARQRSFSQAAQANDVTQSAASQIVSQLERRMGVQLIDRSTRPLQLTALGETYYQGCKTLLDQYLELETSIRAAQAQFAGMLQVAAIYSVGLSDMGQHVERFEARQPGIKVQLECLHPDRVYEKIRSGTADLGLVSFPRKSSKLTILPWREEEMVLACAPNHPLARLPAVPLASLQGEKYIHFDRDLGIRRVVDRFLRAHGVHVDVVLEFDNIENIKRAVEIPSGVALLPEPTVAREVAAGTLAAVRITGQDPGHALKRPLAIIHRRHDQLGLTAQRFLQLLHEEGGGGIAHDNGRANGAAHEANKPRSRKRAALSKKS